jgi:hypothetical protein
MFRRARGTRGDKEESLSEPNILGVCTYCLGTPAPMPPIRGDTSGIPLVPRGDIGPCATEFCKYVCPEEPPGPA